MMTYINSVSFWQYVLWGSGALTLISALSITFRKNSRVFQLKGEKHGKQIEPSFDEAPAIQTFIPVQMAHPSRIVIVKAAITETVRLKFEDACSSSQKLLAAIKPVSPTLEQQS